MANQDARNRNRSQQALQRANEKFNGRWRRLTDAHSKIDQLWNHHLAPGEINLTLTLDSDDPVDPKLIAKAQKDIVKKIQKVRKYETTSKEINDYINDNMDAATNSDLSRYATQLKNFIMHGIGFLIEYGFVEHEHIDYDSADRVIYIDNEAYYFLG
jgi:hypothetical protein